MHCHGDNEVIQGKRKIALVGNPNVGKSVIFGLLTGKYVTVSNYPGTTVEVSRGKGTFDGESMVIDTPGINSLIPMSEDEKVTRDILLNEKIDAVVQVADAKNLRRGLFIALQLAEMEIPFVLNLNMEDEAKSRGIKIDNEELSNIFGVEVVGTIAIQKKGIKDLIRSIACARASKYRFIYDTKIESAVGAIIPLLSGAKISKRSLALMLLAGDASLGNWLHAAVRPEDIEETERIRHEVQSSYPEPLNYVINRHRLEVAGEITKKVLSTEQMEKKALAETLGNLSMHPILGLPVMLAVLVLMYEFVGVFGAGVLVNFFENTVFGGYINPVAIKIVGLIPVPLIRELLVGEFGIVTMALTYSIAIILPVIATFFLAFSVLEDSGYLPRLAMMVNRVFKFIGLNGKAVLPMVLGLGCDTMATLTVRTLETRKEKIIVTLLLALAIPCSAQLGVILGILGGLSPGATAIWAGTVVGVLLGVGYLASKVVPGSSSEFILEIPPMRMPQISNIVIKTLARIEWYLMEAVPLFVLGTLLLFALHVSGELAAIERVASPVVVNFLGLPPRATEFFIIGFLRRDYGAAGLYAMAQGGGLDAIQIVVSIVTITLFVPCVANAFVIVKERGLKTALAIIGFVFPFAFLIGGILNFVLRSVRII